MDGWREGGREGGREREGGGGGSAAGAVPGPGLPPGPALHPRPPRTASHWQAHWPGHVTVKVSGNRGGGPGTVYGPAGAAGRPVGINGQLARTSHGGPVRVHHGTVTLKGTACDNLDMRL